MRAAILSVLAVTAVALASPLSGRNNIVVDSGSSVLAKGLGKQEGAVHGAVTAEALNNFQLYAQYAGAAYCDPVAGRPIFCVGDICPAGKGNNATIWSVFHGIVTDIVGFVAIDPSTQQIVVSVRGTSSLLNWLADIAWARTPATDLCEGCWAHLGFLFAYNEVVVAASAAVSAAASRFPAYKITVTGHSLGGAVGTLLGAHLRAAGYVVDVYTYGSPRVGNEALARYVSSTTATTATSSATTPGSGGAGGAGSGGGAAGAAGASRGNNYRITHAADVVTRLPPLNRDFRHVSPEYWLPGSGPSRRTGYTPGEVAVCGGYAGVACSAGAPWWVVDVESHLYYLVAISHCGGTEPRLSLTGNTTTTTTPGGMMGADAETEEEEAQAGPLNATTAVPANVSVAGLPPKVVDSLAMYAKLDQDLAGALAEGGVEDDGDAKIVF